MILDLHTHSIRSDDGRAKVENYCQWIRQKQIPLDGFVLTEHRQFDAESDYRRLEGASDQEVWACSVRDGRALVSENVPDFRRIEAAALARGEPVTWLIFTTDRQFPRGDPRTLGRLVLALDALLAAPPDLITALFLKPPTDP